MKYRAEIVGRGDAARAHSLAVDGPPVEAVETFLLDDEEAVPRLVHFRDLAREVLLLVDPDVVARGSGRELLPDLVDETFDFDELLLDRIDLGLGI